MAERVDLYGSLRSPNTARYARRLPTGSTQRNQPKPPLTPTTTPLGARALNPHGAGYRQPLTGESGRGRLSPAPELFIG